MRRNNMPRNIQHGLHNQGPLITDHLQDLNLELALLKRKRHMIEQQQQMMSMSNYGSSSYNEQRYDYSYMYDDPATPSFSGDLRTQLGKRRHAINPWQEEMVPYKRLPMPAKGSRRSFDNRYQPVDQRPAPQSLGRRPNPPFKSGSRPFRPEPLMGYKINKPSVKPSTNRVDSKPSRKDFKPNKVTKPKAVPAPNKLSAQPVEQRKKLVVDALSAVEDSEVMRLKADCQPNQLMTGRLELALGQILKDYKLKYSTHERYCICFCNHSIQKKLKQAIRERVRAAMVGQVVDNMVNITEHYLKKFPSNTDKDLFEKVLEQTNTEQAKYVKYTEEDDPEKYFNVNVHKILDTTLHEMFIKLQDIYGGADEKPVLRSSVAYKTPKLVNVKSETNTIPPVQSLSDDTEKVDETHLKTDNKDIVKTTAEETHSENVDNVKSMDATNPEELVSNVEETKPEKLEQGETIAAPKDIPAQVTNPVKTVAKSNRRPRQRRKESELFIESVIKRKMPQLLQKYIPHIIKILNLNQMYKTATAEVLNNTVKKIASRNEANENTIKGNENASIIGNPITIDNSGEIKYVLPPPKYYVKIVARPSLPRRKVMQTFLDKFHPRTIKKHKRLHGLLFVGFVNKEDFDNILNASGTSIGNITLDITVSDWSKSKDKTGGSEADTSAMNNDADLHAVSDLNDQIDDLLSSIRKAEDSPILADQANKVEEVADNSDVTKVDDPEKIDDQSNDKDPIKNGGDKIGDLNINNTDANTTEVKESASEDATNVEMTVSTEVDAESTENGGNVVTLKTEPVSHETTDNSGNNSEVKHTVNEDASNVQKAAVELNSESIENTDRVEALKKEVKETGRTTPTRSSARLSSVTPSTIKTRRASKLVQNSSS